MDLVERLNNISDDVNWCKELLSLIQEEGYSISNELESQISNALDTYDNEVSDPLNVSDAKISLNTKLHELAVDVAIEFFNFDFERAEQMCRQIEESLIGYDKNWFNNIGETNIIESKLYTQYRKIESFTNGEHNDKFVQLKEKYDGHKKRVATIKIDLANEYNNRVEFINRAIANGILNVEPFSKIDVNNIKYNTQYSYFKSFNNSNVDDVYTRLMNINAALYTDKKIVDLYAKVESLIEWRKRHTGDLSKDDKDYMKSRVAIINKLLKDNSHSFTEEIKNQYDAIATEAATFNQHQDNENNDNETELDVASIEKRIKQIENKYISTLYKSNLESFADELASLKEKVEKLFSDGKIDSNKKDSLTSRIDKLISDIEQLIIDNLFSSYDESDNKSESLDKIFTKLEVEISALEQLLEKYKNKKVILRSKIKTIIKRRIKKSKKMLEFLDEKLETEKNNNSITEEYYNEKKTKKEELDSRLNEVSSKYKAKCPLKVIRRKSAKNWFKKHKKWPLYVAGIASLALLFQPVLLPVIIYENTILAHGLTFLKPMLTGINGFISNFTSGKIVYDSAGVLVSLLQSIAICGVNATIARELIKDVKRVAEKGKNSELVRKLKMKKNKLEVLYYRKKREFGDKLYHAGENIRNNVRRKI